MNNKWPALPYENWKDTLDTLHMWMQIAGKVKLALHPFINHWWQVAFHIDSYGLTTGIIPFHNGFFDINFNFIEHEVVIHTTDDLKKTIFLFPRTVADFYFEFMGALKDFGIEVTIDTLPTEVTEPIRCDIDTHHCSYDSKSVEDWWKILVRCSILFESFRSNFRGKSSPVQFFWGSFDLNETRYSGKEVSPPDYGGRIMRFAENEENYSFGFWPGDSRYPNPAFYAYLYPAPAGIEKVHLKPGEGSFNKTLGEFILPYSRIYEDNPEKSILDFLETTYNESAKLAGWDIKSFEGAVPFVIQP